MTDDMLFTPELHVAALGYRRDDVHRAVDAMRKRIVLMRADLERAQIALKHEAEIIATARHTAATILADATAEAARVAAAAQASSRQLLDQTQQRCHEAAQRGLSGAVEMAAMLDDGTPTESVEHRLEQEAFDRFFAGDDDEARRRWMMAS